jgi:WbqC-like protein
MKRVAIVQSCYIPWKGYFDLINGVDEFVLLDEVQFTKRDWRNRNLIKTPTGLRWLTIPVRTKGHYHQRIDQTLIDDSDWQDRHWRNIAQHYESAPCFAEYCERIERLYRDSSDALLSDVNRKFIEEICRWLGISTRLTWSTEYRTDGTRTQRLVNLCMAAGAGVYLSGPRARAYLDEGLFKDAGIVVEYADYTGYPEYPQPHPPFDHAVTILDLVLCVGSNARRFMKSFAHGGSGA